jgi:hypothetical protein
MTRLQAARLARRGKAASTPEDAAKVLKLARDGVRAWRWMRWVAVAGIAGDLALMGLWISHGFPHLVRGILVYALYPSFIVAETLWIRHLQPAYRRAIDLNGVGHAGEQAGESS